MLRARGSKGRASQLSEGARTFSLRRFLMLAVRVPNRGWLLISMSEQYCDSLTPPPGAEGGSVKSSVPIMGNAVTVGAISSALSCSSRV